MSNVKEWIPKLYVVSRRDLKPGAQAVQGMHALVEFIREFPEVSKDWNLNSNYLVFLSVNDIMELESLVLYADKHKIKRSIFLEQDLNNELTAAVFEPTLNSKEMLKELQLALKDI